MQFLLSLLSFMMDVEMWILGWDKMALMKPKGAWSFLILFMELIESSFPTPYACDEHFISVIGDEKEKGLGVIRW